MNEQVEVTVPINLTLSPQHLNVVLAALEELPHKVSAAVIREIHAQVWKQLSGKDSNV